MSSYKTVCVVALAAFTALVAGFMVTSEVRAGDELPEAAAAVDDEVLAQASAFAGEYTFVGGQKEREGIDAAIEASMDAVAPMLRNIGRKRLQETNPVPKHLHIAVDGDEVEVEFDGQGSHASRLDGKPVRGTSSQGDKVKISHRMRGQTLTEKIAGGQGARANTFKLSKDGQRLTVDVEITSDHLPVPVSYRLSFKRK